MTGVKQWYYDHHKRGSSILRVTPGAAPEQAGQLWLRKAKYGEVRVNQHSHRANWQHVIETPEEARDCSFETGNNWRWC